MKDLKGMTRGELKDYLHKLKADASKKDRKPFFSGSNDTPDSAANDAEANGQLDVEYFKELKKKLKGKK